MVLLIFNPTDSNAAAIEVRGWLPEGKMTSSPRRSFN
jgi:hypothetical protein